MEKNYLLKPKLDFKSVVIFSLIVIAVIAGFAGFCCYNIYDYSVSPVKDNAVEKLFIVKAGQGFSSVTSALVNEKLINSPKKFKILGAVTGNNKKIKAGEYLLSSSMTPAKILSVLTRGKVYLYKITIPEGYNIFQLAEVVEAAGFGSKEDFIKAVKDDELLAKEAIKDDIETFEGYLFPDTYSFPRGVKHSEIIRVMLERFKSVYKDEWKKRTEEIGFTIHEVITLASIIEKETGDTSERPIISSVFHNRLKKKMRLETDPTVIYGIKNFDGNLTKKHLREKTPYNTYKIKGLPPGPIANPGAKSIEAALYPADTDYIFFVSKRDGTHKFSTNIKDHINSVRKYQLRRRSR